jgi:hypothetical protein
VPAVVVTVSFFWAQAPKLKAVAKTATIMISRKNFNYLASFRRKLHYSFAIYRGRNVFVGFSGCITGRFASETQSRARTVIPSEVRRIPWY